MKLTKITPTGKNSEITVSDSIFACDVNHQLLAQAVRVYLSNQRQGSSKVKTRSEVKRTKAKWYRQKGTGRARHGSQNAPIFVGGGVAHGPKGNENWNRTLTKKQRLAALISALSFRHESLVVSDMPFETLGKTKHAARFLQSIGATDRRCLIVLATPDTTVLRAFANISLAMVTTVSRVTTYEILLADQIIFTTEAVTAIQDRITNQLDKPSKVKQPTLPRVTVKPKVTKTSSVKTKAASTPTTPTVSTKEVPVSKPKSKALSTKPAKEVKPAKTAKPAKPTKSAKPTKTTKTTVKK